MKDIKDMLETADSLQQAESIIGNIAALLCIVLIVLCIVAAIGFYPQ